MHMAKPPNNHSRIAIDQAILDRLDQIRPHYMDRTTFVNLRLDEGLSLGIPSRLAGSLREAQGLPLSKERDIDVVPDDAALARELINEPSRPKKKVAQALSAHEDLIQDFWKLKKGSKNDRAWSLLQTELQKIQKAHGDEAVSEQLQLAINGKWASVTLRNYQQFSAPKSVTPAYREQSENHPASRVFTAKDFDAPTSNPFLQDLF